MTQSQENSRQITYVQAVNEAIEYEMANDPDVFIMGEDIAGGAGRADLGKQDAWGGVFRLTKGLIGKFGEDRVRDTPISEAGFIGAGVGAAATGMRPIVDLMFVGFFGVCGDQIVNNAAKMHYMFGGKVKIPITIITSTGAGTASAAQHSETLYSVFTHFPGLKCVSPSDPYTAKGLMTAAIRDDDPVIVFNHKLLMGRTVIPEMLILIYTSKLLGLEKSKFVLISNIISTTVLIMGMIALGPIFGILGIVSMVLISTCIQLVILIIGKRDVEGNLNYKKSERKPGRVGNSVSFSSGLIF